MAQVEFPVGANTGPAVREIDELIAALRKAGKEAGLTDKQIDEMVRSTEKAGKVGVKSVNSINKEMGGLGATIKTVGPALAGLFAFDQIKRFVQEVSRVTAEFQKFEAILTNTLGSKSQAQNALNQIKDFAKTTPFQVNEITAAYVRWANQGLTPTIDRMRKLGDIASSLGAGFEQTAEAFKDLMVGQTKRLEEVGIATEAIRGTNLLKLSFKGVTLEIEKNAEGVQKALDVYSQLQGVLGTSDAIIETLGGKVSNLNDAWEIFLNTIGDGNKGILSGTVTLLTDIINKANEFLTTDEQRASNSSLKVYQEQKEKLDQIFATTKDVNKAREEALKLLGEELRQIDQRLSVIDSDADKFLQKGVGFFDRRTRTPEEVAIYNQQQKERAMLVERYNNLVNEGQLAIVEYSRELDKNTKATTDNSSAVKDHGDAWQTAAEKGQAYRKLQKDIAKEFTAGQSAINKLAADVNKSIANLTKSGPQNSVITNLKPLIIDNDQLEREKLLIDELKNYGLDAFQEVLRARTIGTEVELIMLEKRYRRELELAGNNEASKEKISQEFDKKKRALQIKQLQQEQEAAIFGILVNQGPAIAKTAATLGYPLAIPFIAAVGALFALQLNNQRKLAKARFAADGDFDIDGPGTETSDSIPYYLSRRESVVHAAGTKKFGDVLRPMIEDKNFDWFDLKSIVDRKLSTKIPMVMMGSSGSDTHELAEEMRKTRLAIENKKETRMEFDEDGFGYWIGQRGQWTKVVRKRYSI